MLCSEGARDGAKEAALSPKPPKHLMVWVYPWPASDAIEVPAVCWSEFVKVGLGSS